MAGHLDSESVFAARLAALGIPQTEIAVLNANGVKCMANLAYICPIQPGTTQDDSPFFVALAKALGVQRDTIPSASEIIYRRAWYEASTVAIAEVRMKMDRSNEDAPRKMPGPERTSRCKEQQARLTGVKIEGSLKPSHAVLDLMWQIKEEDTLRYVSPEICTSRSQESFGVKKESFVKTDSTGKLHSVNREEELHADMTTEYRIKLAMTRRALAFDNVGICSFAVLEEYHDFLYALVMRELIPTHYPITVNQILQADRQLWAVMIELTQEGIAADSTGKLPIEAKLPLARLDPIFCSMLQPLPKPTTSNYYEKALKPFGEASGPYNGDRGKGGKSGKGGKGHGKGGKSGGWPAKGGKTGKGGTSHGKSPSTIPEELKGLKMQTKSGRSFCWAFNLDCGCDQATPGNWCYKGLHSCMRCSALDHGASGNCPKKQRQ